MISKQLFNNKKKAFTLIELLIVIAIIGILFIVLVSKVDFATDKAKASGVQTDFRSFQMAFDTVAKENAGFNTFGFDTGDNGGGVAANGNITINGNAYTYTNADKDKGDGKRNSYDEGDINLDGKNIGETWTGRKVYTETWTDVWTLVKPGTSGYNADAIFALESSINKNLDPKLHITIASDGKITMANQARDPWKNEYHGYYITNAETDKGDRGAIVMYSNGANGKWGSAHDITNGVVSVTVPGNNVNGKDDYSFVSCYTFVNGYGEVLNSTTGFSNNQGFLTNGGSTTPSVVPGGNLNNNNPLTELVLGGTYTFKSSYDIETVFDVALKSNGITATDGMYTCPLISEIDAYNILIVGFHPDDVADAYAILYEDVSDANNIKTYAYLSKGYIDFMTAQIPPEYASMMPTTYGWYEEDASGTIVSIEPLSVTLGENSILYVPDVNTLLPLFGGSSSSSSITPLTKYEIIDGNHDVFVDSIDEDGLFFRSDADYSKFKEVKINGMVIPADKYTVSEGSTIINLKKEYCESLPDASYTIEIHSIDGYAKGTFEIDRSVKIANNTGVKANVGLAMYGRVWYSADTTAKTLYEFAEIAKANNSSIWGLDEWSTSDCDNSFYYIDENNLVRNLNDIPIEANTTYYLDPITLDSYLWELALKSQSGSIVSGTSLFEYGNYKVVYFEFGEDTERMICHKSSTYQDVTNAVFPFWYMFCDPSVMSRYNGGGCFKSTYADAVVIYYPGTEGFGELTGYLAEVILKNGSPAKFDDEIVNGDHVILYAISGTTDEYPTNADFDAYVKELYDSTFN